jgi:hypothetical protein
MNQDYKPSAGDHPITPPPELVQQWEEQWCDMPVIRPSINSYMAAQAAQWGADTELEACCEWLSFYSAASDARDLRIARRPEPPSLKEQAFDALHGIHDQGPTPEQVAIIRRALEALDG